MTMTKLEMWLREQQLSPEEVATEARISPVSMMKYVTGETAPTSHDVTMRITQACRRLSRKDVSKRDLFDLAPVDMGF
jgi:predicted transcriptional regulator